MEARVERVRRAGRAGLGVGTAALLLALAAPAPAADWVFAAGSLLVPGALLALAAPRRGTAGALAAAVLLTLLLETLGLALLARAGGARGALFLLGLGAAPLLLVPALHALGFRHREGE